MDFIPAPAGPEGQRALPDHPGACPQCGACAWRRKGTYARALVVLGRRQGPRGQCKACLGRASPLPPGVTAHQRPQAFRELVTSLYGYRVSFRGLGRLLDLLGCGVEAAPLWRDPQAKLPSWVEVDETWLSLGGVKRPVAVVPGPQGARLDRRLRGPGFDGGGWCTDLANRGVQGLTTDDDPVHGPAPGCRVWTGHSVPCTGSAPWDGTSEVSTTTTCPTGTGSCCRACNAWPGRDPRRRGPSCGPSGRP